MIAIDKTYLISLLTKNNKNHKNTKKLQEKYKNEEKTLTTATLQDIINTIQKQTDEKLNYKIYQYIKTNYQIKEAKYDEAMYYILKYKNKISLTDATTLNLMYEEDINKILSYNESFDKITNITRIFK